MLILYPTLTPGSQWLGPVITRFSTNEKEVWLTIDDGPDPEDTPKILDLLDRHQARATFFVKGERAARFPDLVGEIVRRGHAVANHSFSHPSGSFWSLPPGRIAAEIDGCNAELTRITGEPVRQFRAPVGMKNPFVHPALKERGMTLIGWSSRGWDTVAHDPALAARRILARVTPGAIILTHEGEDVRGAHTGYACIERVVNSLADQGYAFIIPRKSRLLTG